MRPVTEALKRFELISNAGSEEKNTACAMTLLAWICEEEWSDRPPCTHPLIASAVIRANDAPETTPEMRKKLVRLGVKGALDTWWVPSNVVVLGMILTSEGITTYERAVRLLEHITQWKKTKERPDSMSGAVLSGADLSGADLRRADLSDADLSDAVLSGADLRRADLSDAHLRRADLSGADLSGAVLRRAHLSDAHLRRADLSGAVLSGADLSGAVLSGADLSGADLSDADLRRADLSDADLSGAYGQPYGGMPDGWELNGSGFWVKCQS